MVLKNNSMKKMQKNRFFRNPKLVKNKFGDFGLACRNEGRVELIQISILRKKIKRFITKKRSESNVVREKVWYFGRPNFFIQKKSKNSRMGKGKGSIERKVIRIRKNVMILEFKGISPRVIKNLMIFINKIFSVKMYLVSNYSVNYNCMFKNNKYSYYYDKYLFQ